MDPFRISAMDPQEAKLEGQLGYERGRDLASQSEQRREEVGRDRQRLAELEAQVAAAEGGMRQLEDAIREQQSQIDQIGTEVRIVG